LINSAVTIENGKEPNEALLVLLCSIIYQLSKCCRMGK